MATSDKRKLQLEVGVDDKATKPLKQIGDQADKTEGDFQHLNKGLAKLDDQIAATTKQVGELRAEVAKSGDLALIKDITKAEQKLKALGRQRQSLLGGLGDDAAEGFGAQFVARLGPIIASAPLGPAGAVVGGVVGAAMAPVIGAAVSGAVLGAAGVGGVVGGVTLAARDARVQSAASQLADAVVADAEQMAARFVGPTIQGIDIIRSAWSDVRSDVDGSFDAAAGYVVPLARGVAQAAREIAPGFRDAAVAARPVIREIADGIPRLARAAGGMLSDVSGEADTAAAGIRAIVITGETAIKVTGTLLTTLAALSDPVIELGKNVSDAQNAAFGWIPIIGDITNSWETNWNELDKAMEGAKNASTESGSTIIDSLLKIAGAGKAATAEVKSLRDAVASIVDQNLSAAEASLRAAEAFDAAKEAVDGKRRVTREEQGELIALAQALNTTTDALDAQGVSALQSAAHHDANRQKLIEAARAAGYTKERAAELAAQWLKVPRNVSTTVNAYTKAAQSALSTVRKTLDALDGRVANASVYISAYNKNAAPAHRSAGGPIEGPGPKGVDSVPAVLAPGEYVLDAKTVDRLGGMAAVTAWHRGAKGQQARALTASTRPSGGAMPSAAASITVNVSAGYIATPQQLQRQVTEAVRTAIRKAGPEVTLGIRAEVLR